MKLESEGRPAIDDAQASDVYAAVSGLALPDHSFLILNRTRASYVQVAIQDGERFVIEYREGGPGVLRSARQDFSRNEVARLLESYLAGGNAWRAGIRWHPADGPRPRDAWDMVSTVCTYLSLGFLLTAACSRRVSGRPGDSGGDPMAYLAIAMLLFLPSVLIDMRRFRKMNTGEKFQKFVTLFVVVMVVVVYWIER